MGVRLARSRAGAVAGVASAILLGASLTGRAAAPPPYQVNDYGQGHVLAITPPGENGLVTLADLGGTGVAGLPKVFPPPAHSEDTLPLYANLLYNSSGLTDGQLPQYFVDESFGVPPGKLTRTESPGGRSDVTVYRDNYDIAHVYGQSDAAMEFGAGYVAAEDRLFFMDVLRHVGQGTTTSFLGPSCSDEEMDHQQLLLTGGYSHDDKLRQIQQAATLDPVLGPRGLSMAQAYIDGINQYITEATTDPSKLPVDYLVISPDPLHPLFPQPFDITNVVDIASVIGGQLGRGGGGEPANASLVEYLTTTFGAAAAASIFHDFKQQNDPDAPTTADFPFPYEIPGTIDPSKTVMPDFGKAVQRPDQATTAGCDPTGNPGGILGNPGSILPGGLPVATAAAQIAQSALAFPKGMSNALLVDAAHSSQGHPLAVFGSQAAYFVPEIWMAQDLHSPNYDASGFSIPGISLVVEIGRGQDFAWSATSASSDNQDVRAEILCDPSGGAPPAMGTNYMYNGVCTPMAHQTFAQDGLPSIASMNPLPQHFVQEIYTTAHGVVQGWTTSGGKPIALVLQRSTYEREPYSVLGFLRWGTPALTYDASSWLIGTHEIEFPFNWLYVDDRDIAYGASGRDPMRPPSVDPNLPATGDGSAEWQGFLSDAGHPHQIGSAKGYITSWNNKPAPLFSASDTQYEYGPTYRNQSLVDAILAQLAAHGGKISEANLVSAMEEAATVDLEGTRILPELLPYMQAIKATVPPTSQVSAMIDELTSWLAAGAHRIRAHQGDAQYDHAAAVAIMDELYPRLIEAMFDPLFKAGGIGKQDGLDNRYSIVPFEWANNPNFDGQHLGSAYDGGWDGYVQKLLRQLRGETVGAPFGSAVLLNVCTGGPTTCANAIEHAFELTATSMTSVNGSATVSSWTQTTSSVAAKVSLPGYDALHYRAIGVHNIDAQDWQNRPTQQQVVMFPAHRPRPGETGATQPVVTAVNPNTGSAVPSGAATAVALLAVAGGLAIRRRRRPRRGRG